MKKHIFFVFCLLSLTAASVAVLAEPREIKASGKFVMGDLDSKTDARTVAVMNAQRVALEQAGTYLTSTTVVKDYALSSDEISSLAAGIVSSKVIDEQWSMEGQSPVITVTIVATVNTDDLEQRLAAVTDNPEMVTDIRQLQQDIAKLNQELDRIKTETTGADTVSVSGISPDQIQKKTDAIKKLIAAGRLNDARIMIEKKDFQAATAELDRIVEQYPDDERAYVYRARALQGRGDTEGARADLDTALRKNPENYEIHLALGGLALKAGNTREAIHHLTTAIEKNKDSGPAYLLRGRAFKSAEKTVLARQDFKTACRLGVRKACDAIRESGQLPPDQNRRPTKR